MTGKIFLILCVIFFMNTPAFSQAITEFPLLITGRVIDKDSQTPLAFVSIGILNKPIGTVTDTTGRFAFDIDHENLNDTLQLSLVGYGTLQVPIKEFIESSTRTIPLKIKSQELPFVTISNKVQRSHSEIIGRTSVSKLIQISVHNKKSLEKTIGSELGMRFKCKRNNAILKDFNLYISVNNFNSIRFRVNVYSVKEEMPDTLICERQIFETIDNFKTGWNTVDLEPYNIQVDGPFIITMQWITSRMDKIENPLTVISLALTPFSRDCYARIASQDKWKRMGVHLSSFVTILY